VTSIAKGLYARVEAFLAKRLAASSRGDAQTHFDKFVATMQSSKYDNELYKKQGNPFSSDFVQICLKMIEHGKSAFLKKQEQQKAMAAKSNTLLQEKISLFLFFSLFCFSTFQVYFLSHFSITFTYSSHYLFFSSEIFYLDIFSCCF